MRKEYQLILELCKFENPNINFLETLLHENLDFALVLGQLLYNRLGGIAYGVLKKNNLLVELNRELRSSLEIVYFSQKDKTESFEKSLLYLYQVLKKVDVPYATLKGAYLVDVYPKGYRTSNDIDILVSQENISEISNALLKEGFKQGYIMSGDFVPATRREIVASKLNRGETVPFIKEVNYKNMKFLEIDLNFSLEYKVLEDEQIIGVFLDSKSLEKNRNNLNILNKQNLMLHLCSHLYKEATNFAWIEMGRDLSLYKFVDIYFLLLKYTKKNYEDLLSLIKKIGLINECYFSFYYVSQIFDYNQEDFRWFLNAIKPYNTDFLYLVYNPYDNSYYKYTSEFHQIKTRLFLPNRKDCLKKVYEKIKT